MRLTLVPMPGNDACASQLAALLDAEIVAPEIRRFPDEESYVRLDATVNGRDLAIVCTLDRPDAKLVQLIFLATLARELGAVRVGLIAPYLAYMRQDRRFHNGEAISSQYFARLVSAHVDWLVTIDPHLHRRRSLSEIYSVSARAATSTPMLAEFLRTQVTQPILIGPDSESEQWVASVASAADAPFVVLEKQRHGDRDVRVSVPNAAALRGHTPVLVDDIIATGHTMIETIAHLRNAGLPAPLCLGIHAVFADRGYDDLRSAGAARVVTTNSIPHETNGIDVTPALAEAVRGI